MVFQEIMKALSQVTNGLLRHQQYEPAVARLFFIVAGIFGSVATAMFWSSTFWICVLWVLWFFVFMTENVYTDMYDDATNDPAKENSLLVADLLLTAVSAILLFLFPTFVIVCVQVCLYACMLYLSGHGFWRSLSLEVRVTWIKRIEFLKEEIHIRFIGPKPSK